MLTEDLTVFFDTTNGFAQQATLGGVAVQVIFDNDYAAAAVGMVGMATSGPICYAPSANVGADPVGQPLVINGVTYTVAEHRPDGHGVSALVLEHAA